MDLNCKNVCADCLGCDAMASVAKKKKVRMSELTKVFQSNISSQFFGNLSLIYLYI